MKKWCFSVFFFSFFIFLSYDGVLSLLSTVQQLHVGSAVSQMGLTTTVDGSQQLANLIGIAIAALSEVLFTLGKEHVRGLYDASEGIEGSLFGAYGCSTRGDLGKSSSHIWMRGLYCGLVGSMPQSFTQFLVSFF